MDARIVEPRTVADMVRDLLNSVKSHEWRDYYKRCSKGCCGEWSTICWSCDAEEGDYADPSNFQQHKPGCKLAALILEVETFLEVEEELNGR